MFISLSSKHPLAAKKILSASDLENVSFIGYRKQTAMQNVITDWFGKIGVQPNYKIEVDNVHSTKVLVEAGLGASVLPACALNTASKKDSVRALRVRETRMYRELALVVMDAELLPRATREFAALLEEGLRGR